MQNNTHESLMGGSKKQVEWKFRLVNLFGDVQSFAQARVANQ